VGTTGQMDGGRERARPGRGLMRPTFSPHKVYPASGSKAVLSVSVRRPQPSHVIAGPFGGKDTKTGILKQIGTITKDRGGK